MSLFGQIQWIADPAILEGRIQLFRDGKLVWEGSLEEPFDDADIDCMKLNPADWERLKRYIERQS